MKVTTPPAGLHERSPDWHFEKIVEFTRLKGEIGEPSPHLAIMGYFCREQTMEERLWRLSCYAAVYCLPTAQVLWSQWPYREALHAPWQDWLQEHWKGIVTRQERRCVRTPAKLAVCLRGALKWIDQDYNTLLLTKDSLSPTAYYEEVWDSVLNIPYFGRYIAIRFIEGLRRYCDIPATLPDMRSIGGWSPKKALSYLYPHHTEALLTDSRESDQLADTLAAELKDRFAAAGYPVDYYVLAAMLCEYRGAFENRHQYPGWTIDQEPLLYDKVAAYWGADVATQPLWEARKALFPPDVLGEAHNWNGTRWELTKTLRDYGYNWSDKRYDYEQTLAGNRFDNPVLK